MYIRSDCFSVDSWLKPKQGLHKLLEAKLEPGSSYFSKSVNVEAVILVTCRALLFRFFLAPWAPKE